MIWRLFATAICSMCWSLAAFASVTSKSDHVTARAFGTEGGKAWGLLANDTVTLNPFGTISALDDVATLENGTYLLAAPLYAVNRADATRNGMRVVDQTRAAAKQSLR